MTHPSQRRTSLTDPIRIDEVPYPESGGAIGITFCPGKKQLHGLSGCWDRDLGLDLDVIAQWQPGAMVSLITHGECESLGVMELGPEAMRRGLGWTQSPIIDRQAPDRQWDEHWDDTAWNLHRILRGGGRILVHCMGGLGRAGTTAALLLIEAGMTAEDAMAEVRRCRPHSIETLVQESYLRAAARKWRRPEHREFLEKIREWLRPYVEPLSLPDGRVIQIKFRRTRQTSIEYETYLWTADMQPSTVDLQDDFSVEMMGSLFRQTDMEPWMQGVVSFSVAIGSGEILDVRLLG